MALTDQPYIPLFVDDWMNNNKLKECTAKAHGVMLSVMCIMHKSEEYGKIELKAKYKQNTSKIKNFASYLKKMTCFDLDEIEESLSELIENEVLGMDGDFLICDRMVRDADISAKRGSAGSKGGKRSRNLPTKRLYNEPGYLYVIRDVNQDGIFKIGISKNPEKRLMQLAYKMDGRKLALAKVFEVSDMGIAEDNVLTAFDGVRDGEWVAGLDINLIINKITEILPNKQNASKSQANTGNEIEYENGNDFNYSNDNRVTVNSIIDWQFEKQIFLNDGIWKEKILRELKWDEIKFSRRISEFIKKVELTEEYQSSKKLKKYFVNWNNRNPESIGKSISKIPLHDSTK